MAGATSRSRNLTSIQPKKVSKNCVHFGMSVCFSVTGRSSVLHTLLLEFTDNRRSFGLLKISIFSDQWFFSEHRCYIKNTTIADETQPFHTTIECTEILSTTHPCHVINRHNSAVDHLINRSLACYQLSPPRDPRSLSRLQGCARQWRGHNAWNSCSDEALVRAEQLPDSDDSKCGRTLCKVVWTFDGSGPGKLLGRARLSLQISIMRGMVYCQTHLSCWETSIHCRYYTGPMPSNARYTQVQASW